ncbi:hypothetical protein Tco_0775366 [Tanacetum coccineum]
MASPDHRLNPLFSIKECMSCGALYTRNCGCSKGSLEDKILVPVPYSSQRPPQNCATCGDPVDGLYCRPCAFVRKCLNEGDEHLDTISSVENLVPIPNEFKGISEDTCDVPVGEDSSTFDALSNHSEILSDSNNDGTSSDDDSYENIEYIEASPLNLEIDSLEEVNDVDQEEKEFDLEDIFQIQDVILREKLLNISRLVTNIESLKDNPTLDRVLKSPSSFPIPIVDSDSFFEESDTSFSYSDNSLPKFKTFSDHTEETRSGNVEISLIIETNVPVINNVDELNEDECFDLGGGEINVEVDNSFTFVTWTFLPYLTYHEVSPLLSSTGSEDTIFDPGIST